MRTDELDLTHEPMARVYVAAHFSGRPLLERLTSIRYRWRARLHRHQIATAYRGRHRRAGS